MNAEIVTCCYCGSRMALAQREPGRLRCDGCGAPIKHSIRVSAAPVACAASPSVREDVFRPDAEIYKKQKKQKKKKGLAHRLFDDVSDAIEDFFD